VPVKSASIVDGCAFHGMDVKHGLRSKCDESMRSVLIPGAVERPRFARYPLIYDPLLGGAALMEPQSGLAVTGAD